MLSNVGNEIRRDDGQVLVLVVLCMGVMVMFAALAINVGSWFATDNDLQQKADSAALAGAQYVASSKQVPAGSTCAALVAPNNTGAGCASAYLAVNGVTPSPGYPTQSVDATTGGIAIAVKVQQRPPNPFKGLMNVSSTRYASATVEAIPIGSVANPLPIGVSINGGVDLAGRGAGHDDVRTEYDQLDDRQGIHDPRPVRPRHSGDRRLRQRFDELRLHAQCRRQHRPGHAATSGA